MFRSCRSGFSLSELIIYCAILGFLMTGLYLILIAGLRYFMTARYYSIIQQEATTTMNWIARDLCQTNAASLTVDNASPHPHVVFLSASNPNAALPLFQYDSDGNLLWTNWVAYYRDGTDVYRADQQMGSPLATLVPPPTPPALAAMMTLLNPKPRIVGRNVESLNFNTSSTANTVIIRVSCLESSTPDKRNVLTFTSQVNLRN